MTTHQYCDGIRRRDLLRVGLLGAAGIGLCDYLRLAAAGEIKPARANAAIFVNLAGGPSHLDSFDPKPDAPAEYRGEFRTIPTNVPGIELCEHLPKLARCADKFALLRGVSHSLTEHQMGTKYLNTGNRPIPSLEFPGYGAVVSKELESPKDLPPFVAIPKTPQVAGVLGVEYAPFSTQATPRAGQPFTVRGITIGRGLSIEKIERRRKLLTDIEESFRAYEKDSNLLQGLDRFSQRAHDILSSPRASLAFDVSREPASIAGHFPDNPLAQSCLLALRLVEAGVRFVSIDHGGWDTHDNIFPQMKDKLLPELDGGLAGLLAALELKGLLGTTAVMVTGEFGRTPKISAQRAGRDHYPRAMFVLLAGGGMKPGQVVGASDARGEAPADGKGMSPDDVAASFYHCLGIDAAKEYRTPTGRPVAIVRHGTVIRDLFGG
ncbi:MAG TPA: DUF1501 domain-containing protein [Pirellulaceae bacterium]|nr:DUF1501 domain-containing protein [Pirellulaceae bacterium]